MAIIGNTVSNYRFSKTLDGTGSDDIIYGYAGSDFLYGDGGADQMYGGSGTDYIYASARNFVNHNAYWGGSTGVADYVEGGGGGDRIDFSMTLNDFNVLYGDAPTLGSDDGVDTILGGFGMDYIYGGGSTDYLYGGWGNDVIYGDLGNGAGNGNDVLSGQHGSDSLYGGDGNDRLIGGPDRDWLTGGMGNNTFVISQGDSGLWPGTFDVITDFYAPWDSISTGLRGTSGNYLEASVATGAGYNAARNQAAYRMIDHDTNYAFVTDGVNGYLFGDLDDNGSMDTAIELRGVSSLSQFSYLDII